MQDPEAEVVRTFSTRAELLREKLTEEIMSGLLAPGTRLDEQEIARRFGVSRTPVREAMRHLVATGLVDSQPHLGATVAQVGSDRLTAFLDAATELEVACARLAAMRMDSAERANLVKIHGAVREVLLAEPVRYAELNNQFHEAIYRGAHSEVLEEMLRNLMFRMGHVYRVRLTLLAGARESFAEHERIVTAILSGDAIAAEVAMRAHMSSSSLMIERLHGSALGNTRRDDVARVERAEGA
jgi:DNA-binding GntR family transcriptional regulator